METGAHLNWKSIELIQIPLTFREPFRVKGVERMTRDCLLLRCETPQGRVVWSECSALPTPDYWYETTYTAWWALNHYLIPAVLKWDGCRSASDVAPRLNRIMVGHPMAKSALEMAYWQWEAMEHSVPLSKWLCASFDPDRLIPSRIPLQRVLGETEFKKADHILSLTNMPLKLKVSPSTLHHTIEWLESIPRPVGLDANTSLTPEMVQAIPPNQLSLLEQPFPVGDWRSAALISGITIVLDESIATIADIQTAIDTTSAHIINIKASRVGGFGPALAMAKMASHNGLGVMVGGMHESAVGRWLAMQLAAACADRPSELMPMVDQFTWDVGTHHSVDRNGMGEVMDEITVDEERIQMSCIRNQRHTGANSTH